MRIERMTVVALATAAAVVACSDNNGPGGGGLTGNYTLDSLKVDASPSLVPPIATGSIIFATPNFVGTIILLPPAVASADTIVLTGSYTLAGADSIHLLFAGILPIHGTQVQTGNKLVLDLVIPPNVPGFPGLGTTPTPVLLAWHK